MTSCPAVPESDAVIPIANRLQAAFPLVVATQDWHPPDLENAIEEMKRAGVAVLQSTDVLKVS